MEPSDPSRQAIVDAEHLKLLVVGYYISGGLDALFSLLGIFYMLMGAAFGAFLSRLPTKPGQEFPPFMGWLFAAFGATIFFLFIAFAAFKFLTARSIARRNSRIFCMVVGALSCLGIPWGTLLGVCTLLVLSRASVTPLFGRSAAVHPLETTAGP
jgi:hypothetical protein